MATMTAQYKVRFEGYQGRIVRPDGTEGVTRLFCRGDKSVLEGALEGLKEAGEIKSYEVIWTEIEGQAGEV